MGECRCPDVRLLVLGRHVHQFGHVMRNRGEAGQALARHGFDAHLEREIRHEHGVVDLVGQRAPVGVAQHQAVGALDRRRLEHRQRELGVALVAVEEMLRVEEDPQPLPLEELNRVADHRDALAERLPERFGDVVVPRLADDAHR